MNTSYTYYILIVQKIYIHSFLLLLVILLLYQIDRQILSFFYLSYTIESSSMIIYIYTLLSYSYRICSQNILFYYRNMIYFYLQNMNINMNIPTILYYIELELYQLLLLSNIDYSIYLLIIYYIYYYTYYLYIIYITILTYMLHMYNIYNTNIYIILLLLYITRMKVLTMNITIYITIQYNRQQYDIFRQ